MITNRTKWKPVDVTPAIEVTPITEVDGHPVGEGKPGPITRRIQQLYFDAVHGRLPQYHAWLAYTTHVQTGLSCERTQ